MGGHSPFYLIKLTSGFIRSFFFQILLGKGPLGFLCQFIAMLKLGIKDLHHHGFHFLKGQRMILTHGAGYNQRCSCLINQDGIRLINNAKVMISLHLVIHTGGHTIIPQVIETEFRSRAVSDIFLVHFTPLRRRHIILDASDG